jgi:hypothetical protein
MKTLEKTEAVRRLMADKGKCNVYRTMKKVNSQDYAEMIRIAYAQIGKGGLFITIPADSFTGAPIDRIGQINDLLSLFRTADYILIDSIQDLLTDPEDKEEQEALLGLAESWAQEKGCAVTMVDRTL